MKANTTKRYKTRITFSDLLNGGQKVIAGLSRDYRRFGRSYSIIKVISVV